VTTRCREQRPRWDWHGEKKQNHLPPAGGPAAAAHKQRAAAALRAVRGVAAAAWPLASGAPASGTPRPGNTAGSSAAAGTFDRTPCADTSARGEEKFWWNTGVGLYAESVPREVVLPLGPPERLSFSRSGIFLEAPTA
jgi:hypothetical protein